MKIIKDTKKEILIEALKRFCSEHKIELQADEDNCLIQVWNDPHEVDLDHNDRPKEYYWFTFHRVTKNGIEG